MSIQVVHRRRPKILWILGNHNHNTMLHKVSQQMPECDHWYTPYYSDKWKFPDMVRRLHLLEWVALGYGFRKKCLQYCSDHGLNVDMAGKRGDYDLAVTCSDLLVPSNVIGKPLVGIQEGMVDPKLFAYHVRKNYAPWLPRWTAGSAMTGTSNLFDRYCLASENYLEDFIGRGAHPHKLAVTGIPNFDDIAGYKQPGHWIEGHVLATTSDGRETLRRDDRRAFIERAVEIAAGRPLVFKFHPNERMKRAVEEVRQWAPSARCITEGFGEVLAANCEVLITEWSTLAFVGVACGIETYSYRDLDEVKRLLPLQHGRAAQNIADVCRDVMRERGRTSKQKLRSVA